MESGFCIIIKLRIDKVEKEIFAHSVFANFVEGKLPETIAECYRLISRLFTIIEKLQG